MVIGASEKLLRKEHTDSRLSCYYDRARRLYLRGRTPRMLFNAVVVDPSVILTDPQLCTLAKCAKLWVRELDAKIERIAVWSDVIVHVILHGRM